MTLNEVRLKLSTISSHEGTVLRAIADHVLSGETIMNYSSAKAKRKVIFVLTTLELDYVDDGERIRLTDEAIDKIAFAVVQFKRRNA